LIWGAIGGNLLLVALLLLATSGMLDLVFLPLTTAISNPPGPTSSSSEDGSLTVMVNKSRVKVGEPVHITFTLKNTDGITRVFQAKRYLVMDIRVIDGPQAFWQWSQGRELTPDLFRLELNPGESKTIEGVWVPNEAANNQRVRVVGQFKTEREDLSPDPSPGGGGQTVYIDVGQPPKYW